MKYIQYIISAVVVGSMFAACMDDVDVPSTDGFLVTSPVSIGEVNTTIGELKTQYCASKDGATFSRNGSNWEHRITEDKIFEGVVCLNDGPQGNLYQSILVRNCDGGDQSIDVCIKNTCLYPYFAIGQRVKINLNGLYIGAYSNLPRVGYPYFTSSNNHNLGPIPFQMCATNFELVGDPDTNVHECQPLDLTGEAGYSWLRASANRNINSYPTYATVEGKFEAGDDVSILAPDSLEDAGYAVDRVFLPTTSATGNTTKMNVRTGTGNEISRLVMPKDKRVRLTGVLTLDTYNNMWQINLRDTTDFVVLPD